LVDALILDFYDIIALLLAIGNVLRILILGICAVEVEWRENVCVAIIETVNGAYENSGP